MKSFACFGALPKRRSETAAGEPAAAQKAATSPREPTPPAQQPEPQPTPDPNTSKRDAVKAAWQRMQGSDAEATALGAKKLRSYARVCTVAVARVHCIMHCATIHELP